MRSYSITGRCQNLNASVDTGSSSSRATAKGAVLLAVLGIIFLMSFLVVQFVDTAVSQIRLQATLKTRHEFSTTSFSVLEIVNAVIHEHQILDDGNIFGPSQGWRDPIAYAESLELPEDLEITVDIIDESAKISLVDIDQQRLKFLFDAMEIDLDEADMLTDSLLDWIDEDDAERLNGAEEGFYARQNPPVKPANEPLTSYETLRHIRGFKDLFFDNETQLPNQLFNEFIAATSLYYRGPVNLNGASALVKKALAMELKFDVDTIDQAIAGNDFIVGTEDDTYFGAPNVSLSAVGMADSDAVTDKASMIKIIVHVSQGNKNYQITALAHIESTAGRQNSRRRNDSENSEDAVEVEPPGSNAGDDLNDAQQERESGVDGSSDAPINYPFNILSIVENTQFD